MKSVGHVGYWSITPYSTWNIITFCILINSVFMKNHSCKTQQLLTIEHHSKTLYGGTEIDVVIIMIYLPANREPSA